MQKIKDEFKSSGRLHHAYILEGDPETNYGDFCLFCEEDLNFSVKANPDFIYENKDKFTISDSRRIREIQLNKTAEDKIQILVLSFNFITREAQNALLKVLEEPTSRTHFFIIVPSANIFLDTIISRVNVITSENKKETKIDVKEFINSEVGDRIKTVTKLVTDIKNEKASKSDAIRFVRELQKELEKKGVKEKNYDKIKGAGKLSKVDSYLHDNSASVKTLLEYVSISV
jgi:DNA polymerase III delta prime subunit